VYLEIVAFNYINHASNHRLTTSIGFGIMYFCADFCRRKTMPAEIINISTEEAECISIHEENQRIIYENDLLNIIYKQKLKIKKFKKQIRKLNNK
jgi:hypothetical protein